MCLNTSATNCSIEWKSFLKESAWAVWDSRHFWVGKKSVLCLSWSLSEWLDTTLASTHLTWIGWFVFCYCTHVANWFQCLLVLVPKQCRFSFAFIFVLVVCLEESDTNSVSYEDNNASVNCSLKKIELKASKRPLILLSSVF